MAACCPGDGEAAGPLPAPNRPHDGVVIRRAVNSRSKNFLGIEDSLGESWRDDSRPLIVAEPVIGGYNFCSRGFRESDARCPKHHERRQVCRCPRLVLSGTLCGSVGRGEYEPLVIAQARNCGQVADIVRESAPFRKFRRLSGRSVSIIARNVDVNIAEPDLGLMSPIYFCQVFIRRSISSFDIVQLSSESLRPR